MIQISENAYFNETTGNITVNMNGSGSYVNVDIIAEAIKKSKE